MQLPDFEILCAVWHSKSRYLQAGGLDYGYDDDAKNSGCSSRAVRGKGLHINHFGRCNTDFLLLNTVVFKETHGMTCGFPHPQTTAGRCCSCMPPSSSPHRRGPCPSGDFGRCRWQRCSRTDSGLAGPGRRHTETTPACFCSGMWEPASPFSPDVSPTPCLTGMCRC